MMLIRRAILTTLTVSLLLPGTALADPGSKEDKLLQLIRLTGVEASFDQQVKQLKQQNTGLSENVIQSAQAEFPELPKAIYTKMQQEAEAFLKNLSADLDAAQMVKQYAKYYGEHLTEADVDALITFYQSPIGQKSVIASQKATNQWSKQFIANYQAKLEQEAQTFFVKLRSISEASAGNSPSK